jgi:Methyltransferase FkbM domain
MKQFVKRAVLPAPGPRRILGGLGRGITMEVDFDHETRLYLGLYEIELNRHLRRMITQGSLCYDVGALGGYYALVFAKLARSRVATFECEAASAARVWHNVRLNRDLQPHIQVVNRPVGAEPGQLRLDDFAFSAEGFAPDFIKVDVDGGELSVLRSARHLLAARHPRLIVETHSPRLEDACGRLLVEHGYRPVIVNQRSVLKEPRHGVTGDGHDDLNRWLVCG